MHKIVVQNDLMFWGRERLWNSTEICQSQGKKNNEFDYVFRVPICVIKGRAADKDERKWPSLEELKKKTNITVEEEIYYKFNQDTGI